MLATLSMCIFDNFPTKAMPKYGDDIYVNRFLNFMVPIIFLFLYIYSARSLIADIAE